MKEHMCSRCGIVNRFIEINRPRAHAIIRCSEYNASLRIIIPEPMNLRDSILQKFCNIYRTIFIIIFAFVILFDIMIANLKGIEWWNVLLKIGLGIIPFLLYCLFKKDRPRKTIYAILEENQDYSIGAQTFALIKPKIVPVHYDIKVNLDIKNLRKPNNILYTYTTYNLIFENDNHIYPVLLGVQLLKFKIIRLKFIKINYKLTYSKKYQKCYPPIEKRWVALQ